MMQAMLPALSCLLMAARRRCEGWALGKLVETPLAAPRPASADAGNALPDRWLRLDFLSDPTRDGRNHLAWRKASGLGDGPVVQAADGQGAALHDGAVTIERDFFGAHSSELLEQARVFRAGALGETGVRGSGTEAGDSDSGVVQFIRNRFGE